MNQTVFQLLIVDTQLLQDIDGHVMSIQIWAKLKNDDVLIKTIDVSDYSLRYAEDTAENWEY